MTHTNYEITNRVAVVTLNNPPVNGLGYDLRVSIVNSIDKALKDDQVDAIILTGSEKAFSGGADIK